VLLLLRADLWGTDLLVRSWAVATPMFGLTLGLGLHCEIAWVIRVNHVTFVRLRGVCTTVVSSLTDSWNNRVRVVDLVFVFAAWCLPRHHVFACRVAINLLWHTCW
jgi:hypothetical protein